MAPTHGRCRRGQRLYAKVPHGHWKTTTFGPALRHDGIAAPFVLDAPINGEYFLAYVKEVLAPALSPGDIGLIDNSPLAQERQSQSGNRGRGGRITFPAAHLARSEPYRSFGELRRCIRN
jgi:hypothetical protein